MATLITAVRAPIVQHLFFSSMSSITKYYVGFYLRRSSSQVYKCPMFDFSSQRMDFLVSSANISFSVRLAHPTQPAHPAHPAQLAHPAQPVMGIRFHGYLDIRVILRGNSLISWALDFTDIQIPWIS